MMAFIVSVRYHVSISAPINKGKKGCFHWVWADAPHRFWRAPWCVHLTLMFTPRALAGAWWCLHGCPPADFRITGSAFAEERASAWCSLMSVWLSNEFIWIMALWSHPWFLNQSHSVPLFPISTHCHRRTVFHLHLCFPAIVQIGELRHSLP